MTHLKRTRSLAVIGAVVAVMLTVAALGPGLRSQSADPVPTVVADQVRPCQDPGGFRPSFCVTFPDSQTAPDRGALLVQRERTCASLAREAPDFCLVAPSGPPSDRTLQREVALALLRQRLGAEFTRSGSGKAQVWSETGVSQPVADRVFDLVQQDAAAVERYFARHFREPPAVFLFLSRRSFANALEGQFGVSAANAALAAQQLAGVLLVGADAVAINSENIINSGRPIAYRHELAHVLIHQLAGDQIDPWFDEGLAVVVSAVDAIAFDLERVTALSIIRTDPRALGILAGRRPFQDVNTKWNGRAYGIAAEAILAIEARVGRSGITGILEAIGAGDSLVEVTGELLREPLSTFVARLPQTAAGGCTRGIVTSEGDGDGHASWWLYGVTPQDDVTIAIDGPARYTFHVTTDALGMSGGTVGAPMPAGPYHFSASDAHGTIVSLSIDVGRPGGAGLHACG